MSKSTGNTVIGDVDSDSRIHCSYPQLVSLQPHADSLAAHSLLKVHSILSGRHASRFRGRGLNFEELKHYQIGDDIRNLDWRVTLKTGKPHVRVYTEEKDHHVIVCVDQRSNMYFSSVDVMKSVVAAELASVMGWSVIKNNDRIGLMLLKDDGIAHFKPTRTQSDYLQQLRTLANTNQSLSIHSQGSDVNQFEVMLDELMQLKSSNSLIVIVSDFYGCTNSSINKLQHLLRRNHVLCLPITDPLEQSFNFEEEWVISDGTFQMNIDKDNKLDKVNAFLQEHYDVRREQLTQIMAMNRLPYVEFDTSGHHIAHLNLVLGRTHG